MYFSIVLKVGKRLRYFLVFLVVQIIGFAHAFHILLRPTSPYSLEKQTVNDDPNNPWNLVSSYYELSENGTIISTIVQAPDESTNMFTNFRDSLYAMYFFLTGDSSSFSNWSIEDNLSLIFLMVLFTLLNVIYLMNLLIGIIGTMIEKDLKVSYLTQKAKILAEIELFYLTPWQRRWKTWFPNVIHYHANADLTRTKVKEIIQEDDDWNDGELSRLKRNLLKKLNIPEQDIHERGILLNQKLENLHEIQKSIERQLKDIQDKRN